MNFLPKIITTTNGKELSTDPISYNLIERRTVYLVGEVNGENAVSVITQLKYLDSQSSDDIYFVINSTGGSVADGLAIHDVMKSLHSDICTIGLGMACSTGAFLLAAGTRGKRYLAPSAEVMIHQPLGGVRGQATDISLVAAHIERVKKQLATVLARNCGKKPSEIMNYLERDYWMSAQKAKEFGMVDNVGFPDGM